MTDHWKTLHGNSTHYSINWCEAEHGMEALRTMFPDGIANDLNFVLFSTSGVHGTYTTIEDSEQSPEDITFVVIKPRTVTVYYGNCTPTSEDDFSFLKRLRQTSWEAVQTIGKP